jgi:hypothetical protein
LIEWSDRDDIDRESVMLYAKSPGTERVTLTGSRGLNYGEATATITIVEPDTISFSPICAFEGHLLTPGASVSYTLELFAKGKLLDSNGYDRLVASDGYFYIGERIDDGTYRPQFVAPPMAGPVTVTSPLDPNLNVQFDVVDPLEIDAIALSQVESYGCEQPTLLGRPSIKGVELGELCAGEVEYTLTVLTPDVCNLSPNIMSKASSGYPSLNETLGKVSSGVCKVQVDMPASGVSETVELQVCMM